MNKKRNTSAALVYGVLVSITTIYPFPVVWMCLISIGGVSKSITGFGPLIVSNPTMTNFERLFEMTPVRQNTLSSVLITVVGTVISLFSCALIDFTFAKYKLSGRKFFFYSVIATMLVPPEVGSVPLFIIVKRVGLVNSLWSLIIPKITAAVGIFRMNQYIADVPDGLVEAARIGGCSDFSIFIRIIFPVIKPAVASQGSIILTARWSDFFWPLLCLGEQIKYTLMATISLLLVSEGLSIPWPVVLAGITLVIIPIIVLYLILEKFQKAGMTGGAVEG